MKRILDCKASDFLTFNRHDLLASIQKAEGRTVLAEVIPTVQPLYPEVTNAELARAFGADMILLNMLDVFHPYIKGLESHALFGNVPGESMSDNPILELKRLVGLPIGVNLEPVDFSEKSADMYDVKQGRLATREAFAKASELGIDFICLTGNPNTGVTNEAIEQAIISARQEFAGVIIAGKMHQAGVGRVLDREAYTRFAEAGADIILIPAPGTVPGVREDEFFEVTRDIQALNKLVVAAIGTSQEGADEATVREIALSSKRGGTDVFHIGDAGLSGIATPENIQALSIAIRGRRHTYIRMAASVNR
ncbi:DUF7916 family protein [Exiguobacterium alkaliphilum]|uniref:DUF7916 family protein n=1 Tax=Exiguobacterium alkaliphilum TaxID=1428684 RepID=UPI001BA82AC5|nr:haloacid dehalogenase-like hydrolase [Exiguobacterium alkaliphilum]QUE85517.1 haloacid dehalogenase-like hydrolase [Exiguobacterium alkaliphilum]